MRIEICRTFPSAGVTSEGGLPLGVFHRLGSLRLRKPCRTGKNRHRSHGQSLRAVRGKENERGCHLTQLHLIGRFISRGGAQELVLKNRQSRYSLGVCGTRTASRRVSGIAGTTAGSGAKPNAARPAAIGGHTNAVTYEPTVRYLLQKPSSRPLAD